MLPNYKTQEPWQRETTDHLPAKFLLLSKPSMSGIIVLTKHWSFSIPSESSLRKTVWLGTFEEKITFLRTAYIVLDIIVFLFHM